MLVKACLAMAAAGLLQDSTLTTYIPTLVNLGILWGDVAQDIKHTTISKLTWFISASSFISIFLLSLWYPYPLCAGIGRLNIKLKMGIGAFSKTALTHNVDG